MDEMFVVNFNEKRAARAAGPDAVLRQHQQLRAALWQGDPEGRTALYDAIEMSCVSFNSGGEPRRRWW